MEINKNCKQTLPSKQNYVTKHKGNITLRQIWQSLSININYKTNYTIVNPLALILSFTYFPIPK